MARRIQLAFLECFYNPTFHLCRKRLQREFDQMDNEINMSRKIFKIIK
jgi:hypothetical protein